MNWDNTLFFIINACTCTCTCTSVARDECVGMVWIPMKKNVDRIIDGLACLLGQGLIFDAHHFLGRRSLVAPGFSFGTIGTMGPSDLFLNMENKDFVSVEVATAADMVVVEVVPRYGRRRGFGSGAAVCAENLDCFFDCVSLTCRTISFDFRFDAAVFAFVALLALVLDLVFFAGES